MGSCLLPTPGAAHPGTRVTPPPVFPAPDTFRTRRTPFARSTCFCGGDLRSLLYLGGLPKRPREPAGSRAPDGAGRCCCLRQGSTRSRQRQAPGDSRRDLCASPRAKGGWLFRPPPHSISLQQDNLPRLHGHHPASDADSPAGSVRPTPDGAGRGARQERSAGAPDRALKAQDLPPLIPRGHWPPRDASRGLGPGKSQGADGSGEALRWGGAVSGCLVLGLFQGGERGLTGAGRLGDSAPSLWCGADRAAWDCPQTSY